MKQYHFNAITALKLSEILLIVYKILKQPTRETKVNEWKNQLKGFPDQVLTVEILAGNRKISNKSCEMS